MKLSIILRGNLPDAQNLKIRYRHKNVMVLINTDIVINPKHYQEVWGKWVKPTAPNHVATNINIQKAYTTVEDFCNKYYFDNTAFPAAELVKLFSEKNNAKLAERTNNFDHLTREFLTSLTSRDSDSISMGTAETYIYAFAKIKKFIAQPEQEKYGNEEGFIFLDKIDIQFYYDLKSYLRKEFGNGENTISLAVSRLKSFLYWAIKSGYTGLSPIIVEKMDTTMQERDIIFHTDEELKALFTLDLSETPLLDKYRDVYCLQAVTGFRYSDTNQDRWRLNLEESKLEFLSKKTGNYVSIWLSPEAVSLISKYHNAGKKFPTFCTNVYDVSLKDIGLLAGIDTPVTIIKGRKQYKAGEVVPKWKLMSSHVARATFICSIINCGIPPAIAAEMAGINISTLNYYVKVMDSTIRKAGEQVYAKRGDLRITHLKADAA